MKLIDVLVMISKGELKEGTKVMWGKFVHTCDYYFWANEVDFFEDLNEEVELIEPDHIGESDKKVENIKELDNYEWEEGDYDYQIEILYRKLNEVIRYINKEE